MSIIFQFFQNQPGAGPQQPEKLALSKIKYKKFGAKIKILYFMSVKHIKNTQAAPEIDVVPGLI